MCFAALTFDASRGEPAAAPLVLGAVHKRLALDGELLKSLPALTIDVTFERPGKARSWDTVYRRVVVVADRKGGAGGWRREERQPQAHFAHHRALAEICEDIVRDGFAFRTGSDMRLIMQTRGVNSWSGFASSWDELGLDLYMADGGRYRRRRFATFAASGGTVTRMPRQPHYQSRDHNPLNGGIL